MKPGKTEPPKAELAKTYERVRPQYEEFAQRLHDLLVQILKTKNIPFHTVEHRAKTVDSFVEKSSRPGKTYQIPLEEITDLAGVRVILYYQEDVQKVYDLLQAEFAVDKERSTDKSNDLAVDQFGYTSIHVVAKLSHSRNSLPEWLICEGLVAEIQVRTVLQHAWASISHALQYNSEEEIPREYRRRLMRLAGLLELTDQEFSHLRREQARFEEQTTQRISDADFDLPIDAVSVTKYLESSDVVTKIREAAHRGKLVITTYPQEHSDVILVCQELCIKTLAQLDTALVSASEHAEAFFSALAETMPQCRVCGGPDHWCAVLLVASTMVARLMEGKHPVDPWAQEYRANILAAARASGIV